MHRQIFESSFGTFYTIFYQCIFSVGLRMRGAVLSMLYSKILRLRGLKDKTVGEVGFFI